MALSVSVSNIILVIIDHNLYVLTKVFLDHWKWTYLKIMNVVELIVVDCYNAGIDSSLHVCMLPVAKDVAGPW